MKTTTKKKSSSNKKSVQPVVISMGCPRGVGPEISLLASFSRSSPPAVIVGSGAVLAAAARAAGIDEKKMQRLRPFEPEAGAFTGVRLLETGPLLSARKTDWGRAKAIDGQAQLAYVEEGYRLAKKMAWPLVTGPVSKEVIARSGLKRAAKFLGHTEWLEAMDGAAHSVMCFASPRLTTSLVTTHVPIRKLARSLTPELVVKATLELLDLLLRAGKKKPRIAVCSLNPHGGEGKLLGEEEASVIIPGVKKAAKIAGPQASVFGAIGAETAFRKAASGAYDGVVAMYHDQATIPMKLLDFGGAVNVTQGLSVVRTSVDHGTAYDIAGKGIADARGMKEAMKLGSVLGASSRMVRHGNW